MGDAQQAGTATYRTRRSRATAVVVSADAARRRELVDFVGGLDVHVLAVDTPLLALQALDGPEAPDIAIVDAGPLGRLGSLALCQQIRASAASAATYLLLLSESELDESPEMVPLLADDVIPRDCDQPSLLASVRRALRAQALRRVMQRRERRRAIDWLGQVVSHELNNPLAAALATLDYLQDLIPDAGSSGRVEVDIAELSQLIGEVRAALDRIRRASRRFTANGWLGSEPARNVTAEALVESLRQRLDPFGRSAICLAFDDSEASTVFDATIMVTAVEAVAKAAMAYCGGGFAVSVGLAQHRAAVVLEIAEAPPEVDPELILEPRLTAGQDGPSRFDPGLSAIESRFAALGGQIFVRATEGRWRFGLVLPAVRPGAAGREA